MFSLDCIPLFDAIARLMTSMRHLPLSRSLVRSSFRALPFFSRRFSLSPFLERSARTHFQSLVLARTPYLFLSLRAFIAKRFRTPSLVRSDPFACSLLLFPFLLLFYPFFLFLLTIFSATRFSLSLSRETPNYKENDARIIADYRIRTA